MNKLLELKTFAAASVLVAVCLPSIVQADSYSHLKPIEKSFSIQGQETKVKIDPSFKISGADGYIRLDIDSKIDLTSLRNSTLPLINKQHKHEECGQRVRASNTSMKPTGDGRLQIGTNVTVEQWKCVSAHVPETRCEDTWITINLPFGGRIRTNGIPRCTTRMVLRTAKTKLVSQSARLEAVAQPTFKGDQVHVNVKLKKLEFSGLLGQIMKHTVFPFKFIVKQVVQNEIRKAVNSKTMAHKLPPEFKPYGIVIEQNRFYDMGNGKLGLHLKAHGRLTQKQLADILNKKIASK